LEHKTHGGFKVGDIVDILFPGKQWIGNYVIIDFHLMKVKLEKSGNPYNSHIWVSVFHVRHPQINKKMRE